MRDPRDILISAFYSFGYSHALSPVKEIQKRQLENRSIIQSKTIDEYVLESASFQERNFRTLYKLANACDRSVILKYEDLINNYELFVTQLCKYVDIEKQVLQEIYLRSRPKKEEDKLSHRRSGQVGGFMSKLKSSTLKSLNNQLEETLKAFGYDA